MSRDSGREWRADESPALSTRRDAVVVPGQDPASLHGVAQESVDGATGLYYRASGDGGQTWQRSARLAGDAARNPDLVRAPDGMLAAVWEETNGAESTTFYAVSLDDGGSWGAPGHLSDGGSEATHARVVVAKEGYFAFWLERWGTSERVLQRKLIPVQHRH